MDKLKAEVLFASNTPPWCSLPNFFRFCAEHGVDVTKGDRHNRTDGEVHYILRKKEQLHVISANYWDCRTKEWQDFVDWVVGLDSEVEDGHN